MTVSKLAIAAKDVAAARAVTPIISELRRLNLELRIELYVEGFAAGEHFGIAPTLSSKKGGSLNLAEVLKRLGEFDPDVLLVGCSTSDEGPSIERALIESLSDEQRRKIKIVAVPDYWRAEHRLGLSVDLLLVIDDVAKQLAVQNAAAAEEPVIIGDFVASDVEVQKWIAGSFESALPKGLDLNKTLLVVGQGLPYLPDLMSLSVDCLKESPGWTLVPRLFHPKKKPDDGLVETWNRLSERYRDRIVELDAHIFSTDALAVACGATLSGFSTTLRYAAAAGKLALSGDTEAVRAGRLKSTSIELYPPAITGEALAVTRGIPLHSMGSTVRPFNPTLAAKRILALK